MDTSSVSESLPNAPPPSGDYTESPYLRMSREGRSVHLVVDRPKARNALTNAMSFGIRYAIERVDAEPDSSGLIYQE